MPRMNRSSPVAVVLLACACLPLPVLAQHRHGAVRLEIAIDAATLDVALDAPLEALLGFERAPRTPAERAQVEAMFTALKAVPPPVAAAGCTLQTSEAAADVLKPGAKSAEHADLQARWRFGCRDAAALRALDIAGLLKAFPRIAQVEADVVAPSGQFRATLKRPASLLRWGR
jgi:hypothetical protein